MNHLRFPCPPNEAWYTGRISSDLSPVKGWAEVLNPPPPPPGVMHIRFFNKALLAK